MKTMRKNMVITKAMTITTSMKIRRKRMKITRIMKIMTKAMKAMTTTRVMQAMAMDQGRLSVARTSRDISKPVINPTNAWSYRSPGCPTTSLAKARILALV